MVNGRNKGASFERELAKDLHHELGISFKRDLEQYREGEHGDLIPDDPNFPFTLELKRYKDGPIGGQAGWWVQTCAAAKREGKWPALIYKYDRKPTRCVFPLAIFNGYEESEALVETDFEAFCYIVREMMNG